MKKEKLSVKKRTVLGKKVKKLRKQGIVPATLYGKKVKSLSLELDLKTFRQVYSKTGETGLIELLVEGEKEERPVLIHNLQLDPLTEQILHTDFYQVDLKEKVTSTVPVVAKGESPAVTERRGVLLQPLSEVEVEALPQDLPDHLEANIEGLTEVDQAVLVKDLIFDKNKVTILTKQEELVFKIGSLVTKEAEEELKAEEAKAAAEAKEGEVVESETAAVKEEPKSTEKAEEKPTS
ncbi:50S ribosomal protein L25 [Candidatus Microgenomates bacterium]|nr:50S ribosomal protein L25 [Candidatus Microgenomates bacterium]